MRVLLFLVLLSGLSAASSADVVRCADAAGKVSYTDGACPAGSRTVTKVDTTAPISSTPEPASAPAPGTAPPAPPVPQPNPAAGGGKSGKASKHREAEDAAAVQQAYPSGPTVIGGDSPIPSDSRWSDRSDDSPYVYDGYAYPGGAYRQPPRNMGQKIRKCDAKGCIDTQGNQYNNAGQVIRYPSINGKSCNLVGTTQICR